MILGGLPFVQLDRTGVALLGAIVLVALGDVSIGEAGRSIHAPTLILLPFRGRWDCPPELLTARVAGERREETYAHFDPWQTMKGLTVAAILLVVFLTAPWPRELAALGGAGLLLLSRRLHSRHMLGLVDWELLVLFVGLFVVNRAFQQTRLPAEALKTLAEAGT